MKRFNRLCNAIRTICPEGSLTLTGGDGSPDQKSWKGTISVGCMILAEATGEPEEVIVELTHKLEKMSQRLLRQLTPSEPPDDGPPSSKA
jgi:hypothetical protein